MQDNFLKYQQSQRLTNYLTTLDYQKLSSIKQFIQIKYKRIHSILPPSCKESPDKSLQLCLKFNGDNILNGGYIVPVHYLRTLSHMENNHTVFILRAWHDTEGQVLIRSVACNVRISIAGYGWGTESGPQSTNKTPQK